MYFCKAWLDDQLWVLAGLPAFKNSCNGQGSNYLKFWCWQERGRGPRMRRLLSFVCLWVWLCFEATESHIKRYQARAESKGPFLHPHERQLFNTLREIFPPCVFEPRQGSGKDEIGKGGGRGRRGWKKKKLLLQSRFFFSFFFSFYSPLNVPIEMHRAGCYVLSRSSDGRIVCFSIIILIKQFAC